MGPIPATLLCYLEPEKVYVAFSRLQHAHHLCCRFSSIVAGHLRSTSFQGPVHHVRHASSVHALGGLPVSLHSAYLPVCTPLCTMCISTLITGPYPNQYTLHLSSTCILPLSTHCHYALDGLPFVFPYQLNLEVCSSFFVKDSLRFKFFILERYIAHFA